MVRRTIPVLSVLALAGVATVVCADEGWLKRAAVVRSEQSPAGDSLVNLNKGAKVDVQSRDGSWVQVTSNGKTGWVAADSVSPREVRPDLSLGSASSGAEMSSGAAVRGIQPLASGYSNQHHLNPAGLAQMQDIRDSVSAAMLKDFIKGGRITSRKIAGNQPAKDE